MKPDKIKQIQRGLEQAFIDSNISSNLAYKPQFISASNEPSGHACMSIWRLPRGSKPPMFI